MTNFVRSLAGIVLIFLTTAVQAQSIERHALVSAGQAVTAGGYSVSYSVGETFVQTLSGGNYLITQGFQQPSDVVPNAPDVVINEVHADASETPTDTTEFIELYGTPGASLNGVILVLFRGGSAINNYSSNLSYKTIDLSAFSIPADGFFVVGSSHVANVDLVIPDNTIQNGPDGVGLYFDSAANWPNNTAASMVNLMDAVVYTTSDPNPALLISTLLPSQPVVNEVANNNDHGLSRVPDGGTPLNVSTYVEQNVSPGASNVFVGCTDAVACNYNPFALQDNGSCYYIGGSCNDNNASTINDVYNASCICAGVAQVLGCMDPTAFNYNANANVDDGSCQAVILGCINVQACNYNPQANTSDNSCIMPVAETCDGIDNNCNGQIDEGLTYVTYYTDADGDGAGAGNGTDFCTSPGSGWATSADDCNDASALIGPSAQENCQDAIDNNCDGVINENCVVDADGDGYTTLDDCDDTNASIHPGATELCNGIDENCNGQINDFIPLIFYTDTDADGFGSGNAQEFCVAPSVGFSAANGDCNDLNASINPSMAENCQDAIDNNCDGVINENCIIDTDGDGYGTGEDCDDTNASIHPGATELCNGIDENCNGQIDEGLTYVTYYTDADGDGAGAGNGTDFCTSPGSGWATTAGDCNDASALIGPSAQENCQDAIDNNCDGVINENCIIDTDGDSYGTGEDCDDTNASIHPGAIELCNGIDENCNGQIDEGTTPSTIQATPVTTSLFPICTTGSMMSANLNNGSDSPVLEGTGNDLWYSFTAGFNTLRAGISASYGDNALYLYQAQGGCLSLMDTEHETTEGNQTLFNENLVVGTTYYVAVHHLSGVMNASQKICFNHFVSTTVDHVYSNYTGIYTNTCKSYKATFKANATSYHFHVLSASVNGVDQNIAPWTYSTPTNSSIVTRLGAVYPANFGTSNIQYSLQIPVTFALPDAAGNMESITANGVVFSTTTLQPEVGVTLRAIDRCPAIKAITAVVAPDHVICGATRYQWEFTQVLPVAGAAVTVMGPLNSSNFFLNTVPGMASVKTYNVRVRPVFADGSTGNWGTSQCLKTTGSSMAQAEDQGPTAALNAGEDAVTLFPNPSLNGEVQLTLPTAPQTDVRVVVFNALGQEVQRHGFNESGTVIQMNCGGLSKGLYHVTVSYNGASQTVRWIVQ